MPAAATTSTRAVTTRVPGAVRLGDRLGSRDNNFDLLRLLAAWSVLVSHSFALTGHDEPLHQFGTTLGNVGVLIFFAVSGLLIRRSWEYDPSPRSFWTKRGLRLLPALATVSVLTAFVLGPLVTTVSRAAYFSDPQTWIYPVRVTLLFPFGAGLPGVFEDSIYAGAVNGPLWSLPVEVFAYLVLALLGMAGLLRHKAVVVAVAVLSLVWAAVWVPYTSDSIGAIYVLSAFAVGAAVYSYADRSCWRGPWRWRCCRCASPPAWGRRLCASSSGPWPRSTCPTGSPTPCRRSVGWSAGSGDASYGVYIWAFPIQQALVQEIDGLGPWGVIALATPVVWVLAMLSWHFVERPALRHKPRSSARPAG